MSHEITFPVSVVDSTITIPFLIDGEEYSLCWEGPHQRIDTADERMIRYFDSRGFCLIEYQDLNLLHKIKSELTEEKLREYGLPLYVSIVLPSLCEYKNPSPADDKHVRSRYPGIFRSPAGRTEGIVFFTGDLDGYRALLVKKIE
jgi:hypothetical protein